MSSFKVVYINCLLFTLFVQKHIYILVAAPNIPQKALACRLYFIQPISNTIYVQLLVNKTCHKHPGIQSGRKTVVSGELKTTVMMLTLPL